MTRKQKRLSVIAGALGFLGVFPGEIGEFAAGVAASARRMRYAMLGT